MNILTKLCRASLNLSSFRPGKSLNLLLIATTLLAFSQPTFSATTHTDWVEDTSIDWVEDGAAQSDGMTFKARVPERHSMAIVVPARTRFSVRLERSLDSRVNVVGEQVRATLVSPLSKKYTMLVQPGAVLTGKISKVEQAHRGFGANGRIEITFNNINTTDGRDIPVTAVVNASKLARAGGADGGRLSMTLKRGAIGALTGAAVGAAVGVAGAALSPSHGPYYMSYPGPYYGYRWSYYQQPDYAGAMGYGAVAGAAAGLGVGLVSAGLKSGHDLYVAQGTPVECKLVEPVRFDFGIAANPAAGPDLTQAISFQKVAIR